MSKRIGSRRPARLALAAALAVGGMAWLPSEAAGGVYWISQCDSRWRSPNALFPVSNDRYSATTDKCTAVDARVEIKNTGFGGNGQGAWVAFNAPPGTTIHEVHADANLRSGSGHGAQIAVWNGSNNEILAHGPNTNPTWQRYSFGGLNHPAATLLVRCYRSDGCPRDDTVHLYARNLNFLMIDHYGPSTPSIGGGVFSGGWIRGVQELHAVSSDYGSGVWRVDATVNGHLVGRAESCNNGPGLPWPVTGNPVPCPGSQGLHMNVDTRTGPWRNGDNLVATAAADWSNNGSGWVERVVKVDNENPSVAFTNGQDPEDPELIRAPVSDQFSGAAGGKLYMRPVGGDDWTTLDARLRDGALQARVDSANLPAGEYEFRASVSDVAGNSTETTRRADGEAMKLRFPLREGVQLRAHLDNGASKGQTVPYGTDATAKGQLLDASGKPIAGKEITVVENFGAGALIRERVSQATTNDEGRWESKVPAGPNRSITAHFGGTAKYGSASAEVGKLVVRSRVKFRLKRKRVPEGKAATFKGKVGHFGARIPSGGKLLELQVRMKTGRWDTVGEAFRTEENGKYKRRYRFGKHYTQDALFRFRVKLKNEANWPFRKAASKHRKVIVRAR